MSEVNRYELRIVSRYSGDGEGDIETDASMKREPKGRYVLFSDYDQLRAELAALKALSAENQRVVPVEPLLAPPHPLDAALKAGQGEAWKCSGCGATSGSSCNASGCFENERDAPPATGVVVPHELLECLLERYDAHAMIRSTVSRIEELRALLAQGVKS